MISGSANQDWEIEVIGDGIVDLAVGESKTMKLLVTPKTDGLAEISLTFKAVEDSESVTYVFAANAEEKSSQSAAFGIPMTQIGLFSVIILAVVAAGLFLAKPKSRKQTIPVMPIPINTMHTQTSIPAPTPQIIPQSISKPQPVPAVKPIVAASKPAAICWQCRSPIAGKVVGCPQCGARYCGSDSEVCKISSLETCLSCQSPASSFISE
jgi:hypothetical protein